MLRYDDNVNDLDIFGKLKVTFKGPNSLGNNNENNISTKYRGLDPSYLGKLDINVCGTSDPGTSAILTPFCKTDGLYFDGNNEPESFKYLFDKDKTEYFANKNEDMLTISPSFDSVKDYYDCILQCNENLNNVKFKRKQRDDLYCIEINIDNDDIDQ